MRHCASPKSVGIKGVRRNVLKLAQEKKIKKTMFRVFSIKVSKNISRYYLCKREIALLSNHFPARVRAPGGFLISETI